MGPMRLALSSICENRPRLPFLPNVMLIAVFLSACATPIEPRIVEVTRQVPIEVTRSVSERVEVIREVPVEVTRIVPRRVEVTRVVPKEVVREVTKVVVATPTARARPTLRPATAPPRRIPTATLRPTPMPTSTATPRPTPTVDVDMPPNPLEFLAQILSPDVLTPEDAFAELIADNNLVRVWGFDREAEYRIIVLTEGDPSEGSGLLFDPRPLFYSANTLHVIVPGELYYVGVKRSQRGVNLGRKTWNLEEGWNLMQWPTAGK